MDVKRTTSTPTFFTFDPKKIAYQYRVIYDIEKKFTYEDGSHFILLSGAVGSAKSTLLAWLAIHHCTKYNGARVLLGRKALTDLRDTIFQKVLEMLEGSFVEGVDYQVNNTRMSIRFKNGSEIISRSWHDKKYTKFRSLELSMIIIEELTENDSKDWEFFDECIGRLGRIPHVSNLQSIFIAATNPSDPSHPAYDFWIKNSKRVNEYYSKKGGNRHIYYSLTKQNPYLPKWYEKSLRDKYDPKMIKRMLEGQWIYIKTDVIYYQYDPFKHLVLENTEYDLELPIRLSFDFNIAKGKLMSSCSLQYNPRATNKRNTDRRFTFIDEVAIDGARTEDALEEWAGKGVFDQEVNVPIIVHGDATGAHGDTRTNTNDYEIIEKFLANYRRKDGKKLEYYIEVPKKNIGIRVRHNVANGQLENSNGEIAVAIDKRCEYVDKGFSNTRLKENAGYIEDQSTEGQDMSTAATYALWYIMEYEEDYELDDIEFH